MHLILTLKIRRWNEKYLYVRLNCNKMHGLFFLWMYKAYVAFAKCRTINTLQILPALLGVECPFFMHRYGNKKLYHLNVSLVLLCNRNDN